MFWIGPGLIGNLVSLIVSPMKSGRYQGAELDLAKRRKRTYRKPGLPPGTLAPDGIKKEAPVRITVMDYDAAGLRESVLTSIDEVIPFHDTNTTTWINIDGLGNTPIIEKIGHIFDIHPLILEDVLNTGQRPKMEDLDDYLYVNLKMLSYMKPDEDISAEHVSMIIGQNVLILFQERSGDVLDPVRERIRKDGKIRKFGVDYLAYAIIDDIVDNYFLVMENLEEEVEALEEEVVIYATRESLAKINHLKKEMIFLRKSIWPVREVISGLERTDSPLMKESTAIYLRDVYDHTIQVIDTLDTLRDMVSGMIDIYLSGLSYRGNEIMKVLTLIATIFIPLTFVVGVYGMNFRYMPELDWEYGYYSVWVIMAIIVLAMVTYFRRKGWI